MIRNLANRVVSDGIGAYDAELGTFQAAGQIINQVYQRVAYESIRGAARAAITAMTARPRPMRLYDWLADSPPPAKESASDATSPMTGDGTRHLQGSAVGEAALPQCALDGVLPAEALKMLPAGALVALQPGEAKLTPEMLAAIPLSAVELPASLSAMNAADAPAAAPPAPQPASNDAAAAAQPSAAAASFDAG